MQALVHFTVGLTAALLILCYVDWPPRQELLWIFVSGLWALFPDFHWFFRDLGLERPAIVWKGFHSSLFADFFWFHRLLDSIETSGQSVEVGFSLAILFPSLLLYYRFNDWAVD